MSSSSSTTVPSTLPSQPTTNKVDETHSPSFESGERVFQRWKRRFSEITGVGLTAEERMDVLAEHHRCTCEKWKEELTRHSPAVSFMLQRIRQETGVDVNPSERIVCLPCDKPYAGGFTPELGSVILCQGNFWSKKHMEHTLTHELVHMYDHCKFDVDWNNLRHHACSEIRANSLGGDCKWGREVRRLFFNFSKQHQACVRRRAIISVESNPACPNREAAERAVNEVWDSCFNDTRPFDEIY